MADYIIDIQLKLPGGVKTPIVTGDKRVTAVNLAKLIRSGLVAGNAYGLAGSEAYLQVQPTLVAASATATCAAVQANDTVTIGATAITAAQKRATGTLTAASVAADDTCVINGVTFTAVDGAVELGEATFDCSGTDTDCATSLAAQVNGYASPLLSGVVAAKSAAAVATLYAVNQGTSGNAITLVGTAVRLEASAATLENGEAIANNEFDMAGTNATTAAALAAAINASTTAEVQQVTAEADDDVVTVTSKVAGLAGNTIVWESSNGTRLAVTGSGFLASGSAGAVTRWSL